MAEYRLTPRAQRDLDGVLDYTVTRWGLPQAMRYTDRIEAACADLAEAPQQAQGCAKIRPSYRRRAVEQHVIYFGRPVTGSPSSVSCISAWTRPVTCEQVKLGERATIVASLIDVGNQPDYR
jgi:toxin ParE1/3/4